MHRFVVAKATMWSRQIQVWCSNLRLNTKFYFILLPFRAADVISQFKLKMRSRKFWKKKKNQFFFFSFSSMKSISSHFGGKRNFFCSEIIYTKTGLRRSSHRARARYACNTHVYACLNLPLLNKCVVHMIIWCRHTPHVRSYVRSVRTYAHITCT